MLTAKKITGNSGQTVITLSSGKEVIAKSEFLADSTTKDINGIIVHKQTMRFKDSNALLTADEIAQVVTAAEQYRSEIRKDFNIEWD